MRFFFVCLLLFAGAGSASPQGDNPATRCFVSGHVSNILSGVPIKGALIHLETATSQSDLVSATATYRFGNRPPLKGRYAVAAQGDGFFCFDSVDRGQYRLSGSKLHFLETNWGAASTTESGKIISVGSDPVSNLDLKLIPQSAVSGVITDDDDEPAEGATVKLLKQIQVGSAARYVAVRAGQTNDLGQFRIAAVSPGTYYLVVEPRKQNPSGDAGDLQAKPLRTFAPGVSRLSQATPMIIRQGEEISGINVHILTGVTHHIRGRAVGPVGTRDTGAVIAAPEDEEPTALVLGSGALKPDGTFDFPELDPGTYVLKYVTMSGESSKGGQITVEVADHDLNNIALTVVQPATIRGRIKVEACTPNDTCDASLRGLKLVFTTADAVIGPTSLAAINYDGTFTVDDVTPGRYFVRATSLPGVYLSSIRYGSADVLNKELNLMDGGTGQLSIVFKCGVASVGGVVESSKGSKERAPAYVVLIPAKRAVSFEGDGILLAQTSTDNSFLFTNVPPDHYSAYAFESIDFSALRDPHALTDLLRFATDVEVKEGEQKSVTPKLTSAEDVQQVLSRRASQ